MQIAKQLAGFSPAEAETLRTRDRQEDPRADGVAEGQVPRGRARRTTSRPAVAHAALEGHGAVAGLLLQQGALRLLRADRLPHRLAEGEPPVRVHGRADLLGDEHEGPRAALRQRLPRDRDRGAAAGRELVRVRLRGRRGEDPLRPQRGQERRRRGRAGDRPRAQGGRAVRVGLGLHRARRPQRREQARARVADQVRRARLDRRTRGSGCSTAVLEQALAYGQRAAGRPARGAGLDLRPRRRGRARRRGAHGSRRSRTASGDKSELLRLEKETLGLYVSEHPLQRAARPAAQARPTARSPSSSGGATARSSRSAASSARSSS